MAFVVSIFVVYYGVKYLALKNTVQLVKAEENSKLDGLMALKDKFETIKKEIYIREPAPGGAAKEPVMKQESSKAPFTLTPPPPPELTEQRKAAMRALELYKAKDYAAAARIYEDLAREDLRALLPLGLSYYMMDKHAKAVRTLEESLTHNEEFVARKVLARIYYARDELERSIGHAERALAIKDDVELSEFLERAARQQSAEGEFIRESTAHFTLLFDGYAHGGMSRKVIGILEDAYRTIGREINHFPPEPVTVFLYAEEDFYDVTRQPRSTRGLYDGKIRLPLRGALDRTEMLRRVIFHEYAHAVVHSITGTAPAWLNEGLAEYFSGSARPDSTGQDIPLDSLEDAFTGGLAYDVSYSAVKHLIDRHGLYSMKRLLVSLSKGRDLNGAFTDAFYISYDEFVSTWGKG